MNGLITQSWEDYVALDRVNHSRLKRLKDSPWHYQRTVKSKESADLAFGKAFHSLLLEPEDFALRYVPAPTGNKNSNAYKDAASSLKEKGQEPIGSDDWVRLHSMREAVLSDPFTRQLFREGQAEASLLFEDALTDLPCKARLDWLPRDYNIVVDLKTTRSGSPDSLRKSAWDYGYHTQAAFYSLGWEIAHGTALDAFLFVFVEKPTDPEDTPLPPQLYELDTAFRQMGERQVRDWLTQLKRCYATYGDQPWPHYTQGLTSLNAPYWAKL